MRTEALEGKKRETEREALDVIDGYFAVCYHRCIEIACLPPGSMTPRPQPVMPLSWNEIHSRAMAFSKEWLAETREDAEAKTFWDQFSYVFELSRR